MTTPPNSGAPSDAKPLKRKRRKNQVPKKRLPKGLGPLADQAIAELIDRPASPRVLIEKTKDGWGFGCPYAPEDAERWEALLYQAFGTRSQAIMTHFLNVLTKLVGDGYWDEERHAWMPHQDDFDAMVAIVHALRPENEAQAAHAAQLCALHISAMKLGEQASRTYCDPRTVAILGKTVRAYGDGMERLARLQGKILPRTINQTIQVIYSDNRDQRTVVLQGGGAETGGRPHGTDGSPPIQSPPLPSPDEGRAAVPRPSGERQTCLSIAWWRSRIGRAFGRT